MPRAPGLGTVRILAAIHEGETFGLDIVAHTGMPSGSVYPTLGRLRKRELIRARWEDQRIAEQAGRPRRRYYELTAEGSRVLEESIVRVRGLALELDGLERAR